MASEERGPESSTTVNPRFLTTLTVGRRTYRKVSRRDRRRRLEYTHPELRLSNRWLAAAGVSPGDRVFVVCPKPGYLVITPAPRDPQPVTPTTTVLAPVSTGQR
jgi:hypothetical protein